MSNAAETRRGCRCEHQRPTATEKWDRRQALAAAFAACFAPALSAAEAAGTVGRSSLGLVTYCCSLQRRAQLRRDADRDLFEPKAFLRHCRDAGAGGMQLNLGVQAAAYCRSLRDMADQDGLFIEAIVRAPFAAGDLDRFTAEVETAANSGAKAIRTTIIPGRRYEFFESLDQYRHFAKRGQQALEQATPVVERFRIPLAIENHKDQRIDERIRLFERISSEYVGACVDTGNSIALLEDPMETAKALAPWAHAVHLKDQALQRYEQGFLLGDIPLGQGCLPLRRIVDLLQSVRPHIRFSLELITRDPLQVPVLTSGYWTTFPDVPASELVEMLEYVRQQSTNNLQYVSQLDADQQVELEALNVRQSVAYARRELGLIA